MNANHYLKRGMNTPKFQKIWHLLYLFRRKILELLAPAKCILSFTCLCIGVCGTNIVYVIWMGLRRVSGPQPATWDRRVQSLEGGHVHSMDCQVFGACEIVNPQVSFKTSFFPKHRIKRRSFNLSSPLPFSNQPHRLQFFDSSSYPRKGEY